MTMSQTAEATSSSDSMAVKLISAIAAVVGLLLLVTPFVFDATDAAFWNHIVVGLAIFFIAAFNYYRVSGGQSSLMSAIGIMVLLGAWTIISPFTFEVGSTELFWSTVLIGVLTLIFGGSIATSERRIRAAMAETVD